MILVQGTDVLYRDCAGGVAYWRASRGEQATCSQKAMVIAPF